MGSYDPGEKTITTQVSSLRNLIEKLYQLFKYIFILSLLLLLALMHNGVLIYILLSMLCKSTYLVLIFL